MPGRGRRLRRETALKPFDAPIGTPSITRADVRAIKKGKKQGQRSGIYGGY